MGLSANEMQSPLLLSEGVGWASHSARELSGCGRARAAEILVKVPSR